MMTEYETIYVTRPDIDATAVTDLSDKVQAIFKEAKVLHFKDWGTRKLAYLIDNHRKGHYFFVNYIADSSKRLVAEVERNLRYDEKVIRFLTVEKGEVEDVAARVEAAKRQEILAPKEFTHDNYGHRHRGERGDRHDHDGDVQAGDSGDVHAS